MHKLESTARVQHPSWAGQSSGKRFLTSRRAGFVKRGIGRDSSWLVVESIPGCVARSLERAKTNSALEGIGAAWTEHPSENVFLAGVRGRGGWPWAGATQRLLAGFHHLSSSPILTLHRRDTRTLDFTSLWSVIAVMGNAGIQGQEGTGDPRETSQTSGIFRRDPHLRKSGKRTRFALVGGTQTSSFTPSSEKVVGFFRGLHHMAGRVSIDPESALSCFLSFSRVTSQRALSGRLNSSERARKSESTERERARRCVLAGALSHSLTKHHICLHYFRSTAFTLASLPWMLWRVRAAIPRREYLPSRKTIVRSEFYLRNVLARRPFTSTWQTDPMVRLLSSNQGGAGSIPGGVVPGFPYVGIAPDDAAGRRIFSRISRFPRPCIPALLLAHFASPSSALKTPEGDGAELLTTETENLKTGREWLRKRERSECWSGRLGRSLPKASTVPKIN
ncbi:hypothetical protein PR048_003705 [Dryococelus australis]|uniref:Uncharacterized protein n=1 Tax=Dryococelus australis TaxID=614101 RepID=A0ABQ9IQ34_9NEOP|nr:hypothetical protein PR048_003705 [Dryococelus australis]